MRAHFLTHAMFEGPDDRARGSCEQNGPASSNGKVSFGRMVDERPISRRALCVAKLATFFFLGVGGAPQGYAQTPAGVERLSAVADTVGCPSSDDLFVIFKAGLDGDADRLRTFMDEHQCVLIPKGSTVDLLRAYGVIYQVLDDTSEEFVRAIDFSQSN